MMGYPIFRRWGDISQIAAACGAITPQSVSEWKRVPRRHVETVAAMLGVPPGILRPDLNLARLAAGETTTLLELLLAWRIVHAARTVLARAEQACLDAEAERDRIAAELLEAEACLARERTIWRPEMLDMRQDAIEHLTSRLQTAQEGVARANERRVAQNRAMARSGLPAAFLDHVPIAPSSHHPSDG
ncbi:hypothetical protein AA12717_2578 [Gluconacetobacter sacchari DSM 12717]|uniref:Uncharacterized protein n=2 Tax=Gluconacetobacter sacchari TaxID=92759 RepID=A0A7W4IBT7_9PROT|nr:hypothetical protein [Gluconacetobacter sacchari]MBB2159953.1 hypothetical protein [Gluconacetobacter sacchari]GBQ27139.1 hypothetical protein AA12717_2578 [Gluconacetobacter sacchari DSM 12717]